MARMFPDIVQEPGSHSARFLIGTQFLSGTVNISAGQAVTFEIFDDETKSSGGFPRAAGFEVRRAQLRSNMDVVLVNTECQEMMPGQYWGYARYALVGLGTHESSAFERINLQIEGLDTFFGAPPLQQVKWPAGTGQDFGATLRAASYNEWTEDEFQLSCYYSWQVKGIDGYGLDVAFAPVITVESERALTPEHWINEWITPLQRLVSFGTNRRRGICWIVFETGDDPDGARTQMFAPAISQQPYVAKRPVLTDDGLPLFTCSTLPGPLPTLVDRWRQLDNGENPFVELYRSASAPDVPARARFLYLVQALEGLHDFEWGPDEAARVAHANKREEILREVRERLNPEFAKWLSQQVDRRLTISLDRRLKTLIDKTPESVRENLCTFPSNDPIAVRYAAERLTHLHQIIRAVRNDLSHGGRSAPREPELKLWIRKLDRLSQAHLLRLLGFAPDVIATRLTEPIWMRS